MTKDRGRIWRSCFLTLVLLFTAAPILIVIANSFNASPFSQWPPTGFTLKWYADVIDHQPFRSGFVNSLKVSIVATICATVLGTTAAYLIVRFALRGGRLLNLAFFLPLTVPRVTIGFALFALLITWRTGIYGSITGIAIGHIIIVFPFVVAIISANLKGLDAVYEEAARDLGADRVRTFLKVTLPQMRTGILIAALFSFIVSFDELEMSIFLVRPATNTLPVTMFLFLENEQSPALAALSTLLVLMMVVLVLVALPFILRGSWRRSMSGIMQPRRDEG